MSQKLEFKAIKKPRVDDHVLWDVVFSGNWGYRSLLLIHFLKLMPLIALKPRTVEEICEIKNLAYRPVETLLIASASLGLVTVKDKVYSVTPMAEDYFLEGSPTYFGDFLDWTISISPWFESLKEAVLKNSPHAYGDRDSFQTHEENPALARSFTRAMHARSMGAALAWPELIDLSKNRLMLDIGGGSGAHALGAAMKWPDLKCIIFDLSSACENAKEYIAQYGRGDQVSTIAGDMWKDPFPTADLHFYSAVYHDWPDEKLCELTRKSFESLKPGGRIIIHEMVYNDEKTGPLTVAGYSLAMMMWSYGEHHTVNELKTMLTDAGFVDIEFKPTFGYWNIIVGLKP